VRVPKNKVLHFPETSGFRPFSKYFIADAITHPAKANCYMLHFLIEAFTKPGDMILDPMAGTGSTGVVANLLGRNAILVDLEEKFCRWMRENVKLVEKDAKGKSIVIQGDSRHLSSLLSKENINTIITSPPYSESLSDGEGPGATSKNNIHKEPSSLNKYSDNEKNIGNLPHGDLDQTIARLRKHGRTDPKQGGPYGRSLGHPYSPEKSNIGNLPHGEIDAIITSPPYGDTYLGGGDPEARRKRLVSKGYNPKDFLGGKAGNAVLKHYQEVDTILTSPPYVGEGSVYEGLGIRVRRLYEEGKITKEQYEHFKGRKAYFERGAKPHPSQNNIAKLPHGEISAIITSPPYSDAFNEKKHTLSGIARRDPNFRREVGGYGEGNKQIGNLPHGEIDAENKGRTETYLSAMLKVYRECWKVLKPGGLMIVIVKNFIRNKQIVPLDQDTIKLCQAVGFQLIDRYYRKLKQKSFWRILYHKRYPSVPTINYEHILIFQKVQIK